VTATPRLVICDDEPITRTDLKEILEEAGYLVVGDIGDGLSAVELCRSLKPDLLLADIKMPGMDGISVARTLVREMGDAAPAVVLLTAYRQRDLVEDAVDSAVDAYLLKPVGEDQLVAAVEVALARRRDLRRMRAQVDALDGKLKSRKSIERAKGILMARRDWTEEQAYAALRTASMRLRVPIEKVAEKVISGDQVDHCLDS